MHSDSTIAPDDLSGLARAIKITVILFLATQALTWLTNLAIIAMRVTNHPLTPQHIQYLAMAVGLIALIMCIILLVCAILFLIWLARAHRNLARVRLGDLAYRPAWAVASYFVPIANLIVPLRAMRELWNRSHGEDSWNAQIPVSEVSAWWTCTLVFWLLTSFVILKALINAFTPIKIWAAGNADSILMLFTSLLLIGMTIYIARLTGAITRAQRNEMSAQSIFA